VRFHADELEAGDERVARCTITIHDEHFRNLHPDTLPRMEGLDAGDVAD
jgi:hypothetical protein